MRLAVACVTLAATLGPAAADSLYVVCDNGLRCVTAPCPSTNALDLVSGDALHGVYVDATRLPDPERERAENEQAFYGGSLAFAGSVEPRAVEIRGRRLTEPYVVVTRIARRSTVREQRACRAARR